MSPPPRPMRVHLNDLEIGEPFRYSPDPGAREFRRVGHHNDPVKVVPIGADGEPIGPPAKADAALVYRVNPPRGRDADEQAQDRASRDYWERFDRAQETGEWSGLGLSGIEPDSGEETGGGA